MKWFYRMRVGSKIITLVILFMVIAVAAIAILGIAINVNTTNNDMAEETLSSATNIDTQISDYRNDLENKAIVLAMRYGVPEAAESKDRVKIKETLSEVANAAGVDYVTITDESGVVLYRFHDAEKFGDSIANQKNIQMALKGSNFTTIEACPESELAVLTGVPIRDTSGAVVGTVCTGYRLTNNAIVDTVKKLFGTEVTLYKGDTPICTTFLDSNNARDLSMKMDSKIAEKVLTDKKRHIERVKLHGKSYLATYIPLLDTQKNVVGAIFAGAQTSKADNIVSATIWTTIGISLLLLLLAIFFMYLLVNRSITRPFRAVTKAAERLAAGNLDVDLNLEQGEFRIKWLDALAGKIQKNRTKAGSGRIRKSSALAGDAGTKDEAACLQAAFQNMAKSIREQADAVQRVAEGEIDVTLRPRSEKDVMTKSLNAVIETLKELSAETGALTQAAIDGELGTRAHAEKFQGGYRAIIQGMNDTLDAVIKPVNEAAKILYEMANGNLRLRVEGEYKGDHALIKDALNSTLDAVSAYIGDISRVLGEIANANLNVTVDREYQGDFVEIKHALNNIISSLNELMSEISRASEQVEAGSRQISDSSTALAQGATEQASSVEQLTASLEEVAVQTRQNAENAGRANELSELAKNNAAKGNSQMQSMLEAMQQISRSSDNIYKIIKVIDDIAFQTNILSLNAAVEAARAGEQGRGFAVVAQEVRNLAARSGEAAQETADLIQSSIGLVKGGTKIAEGTADALRQIVANTEQSALLIGDIAIASNQQSAAIGQINQGVTQVSMVVQANSATSEETAAASEQLLSQSRMLQDMIAKFRLREASLQSAGSDEKDYQIYLKYKRILEDKEEGPAGNTEAALPVQERAAEVFAAADLPAAESQGSDKAPPAAETPESSILEKQDSDAEISEESASSASGRKRQNKKRSRSKYDA